MPQASQPPQFWSDVNLLVRSALPLNKAIKQTALLLLAVGVVLFGWRVKLNQYQLLKQADRQLPIAAKMIADHQSKAIVQQGDNAKHPLAVLPDATPSLRAVSVEAFTFIQLNTYIASLGGPSSLRAPPRGIS